MYQAFCRKFEAINDKLGLKQFVVPYLMSSHPGSTLKEAIELAEFCRDMGFNPEQVQDFYPTPSTMSTAMYYTGVDPRTMKPVYTPKKLAREGAAARLSNTATPPTATFVREALRKAHREDLIGFGPKCLVRRGMARAVALAAARESRAHMEPASAEMVLEAVMAARAQCRAVAPMRARRSAAAKAACRMAAGNMLARIVPTSAMAQSALAVSGA